MKYFIITAWFAAIITAGGQAERLSEDDRKNYLERVRAILEASDSQLEARFRVAIQAYRAAMGSDEAAFSLYMNCVEKVDFTDRNRSARDFREWRRNNDNRLGDPAFRRALRHQLRWLVLTLQATNDDADRRELASNAQDIIDSIVNDASNLTGHENILNQSVTASVFARAYDIGGIEVEDWVLAPGRIPAIYDEIIMPQHRIARRADALRDAWTRRIQQQTRLADEWSSADNDRGRRIGMARDQRSEDYQSFVTEQLPQLQWQMEVDVFQHGDPAGAAPRMLAHISRHAGHSKVRDWVEEFESLLTVRDSPSGSEESGGFPESWEEEASERRRGDSSGSSSIPAEPPPDPDSIFND